MNKNFNFNDFVEEPLVIIDPFWYRERYDVPSSNNETEQNLLISKFIDSAVKQFDGICSGKISIEVPKLNPDIPRDKKDFNILQSCVGDWVEYLILTGKAFADLEQSIQSSVPFDIKRSSLDGDIEIVRPDILRKLGNTRFYETSGGINLNNFVEAINNGEDLDDEDFLILVSKLKNFFLTNDNSNTQNGSIVFSKLEGAYDTQNDIRQIVGSSNIISNAFSQSLPEEYYPALLGYVVNKATVSETTNNANAIFYGDAYHTIQDLIDDYGLAFFGGALTQALTRQEIYNLLTAISITWQPDISYAKGVVVQYSFVEEVKKVAVTKLGSAISLIDNNLNHNPVDEVRPYQFWELVSIDIDITEIVEKVKKYVDTILPGIVRTELNKLPTVDYISEYKDQILEFPNEASFNAYKSLTGTTDIDYQDYIPKTKVFFFKGEIKTFDTGSDLNNFVNRFGLVNNVDYKLQSMGSGGGILLYGANRSPKYIAKRNNGVIDQQQLQKMSHSHYHQARRYSTIMRWDFGSGGEVWNGQIDQPTQNAEVVFGVDNPSPIDSLFNTYTIPEPLIFLRDVVKEI